MKKTIKIFTIFISIFMLMFTLTSCDIEGLLNEYLPGVELPFGDKTKEPTNNETNNPTYGNSCKDGNHNFGDYYQNNETHHYLTCQDCGEYKYESHEFTDWTIIEEPTEHSIGLKMRTCNICKWDEKVDIPMLDKEDTPTDSFVSDCYGFRMHYYRPDGNYDGWNLWVWKDGFDGNSYYVNGNQDDNGITFILKWADVDIYDYNNTKIGFIVRKGEWESKDVEEDRFIDFSYHTPGADGFIDFYLISGEHEYYVEPQAPKLDNFDKFNDSFNLLISSRSYSFDKETNFIIDEEKDIAYINYYILNGDSFIVSSYSKEVIFNYKNTKLLDGFTAIDHKFVNEIICNKEGYYKIVIYNYSDINKQYCEVMKGDTPDTIIECTVAEAFKLPLGTKVRIIGYAKENGNYMDIQDSTGVIRMYDISGHAHDGLYGVVEGVLYDYKGTYQIYPSKFEALDKTQLPKVLLGNIIKDDKQIRDGMMFTLGTETQITGCWLGGYYYSNDFVYTGDYINQCVEVFTLYRYGDNWLIQDYSGKYLYSDGKSGLFLDLKINDYCYWNVITNPTGEVSISNVLNPKYSLKFNTGYASNRLKLSPSEEQSLPLMYEVIDYKEPSINYEKLYVRGSFNYWNVYEDYMLKYDHLNSAYYYSIYLHIGDEFKVATADWDYQLNSANSYLDFPSLHDVNSGDNIIVPYEGTYNIYITNYKKADEKCTITFEAKMDDVFLTCSEESYQISYRNKFMTSSSKNNLYLDIEISIGSLFTYSIVSLYGIGYFKYLGQITDHVSVNDEYIDFKNPGSYKVIIENYNKLEECKLHILVNNEKVSIEKALTYPESAQVTLEGKFVLDGKTMFLVDSTGTIKLSGYPHIHDGDYGYFAGQIIKNNGDSTISTNNITVLETKHNNVVSISYAVENTSQLQDGMKISFAYANYFMTCQNSYNYRNVKWYGLEDGVLNECIAIFTLLKIGDYWKFLDINGGYLYLMDDQSNTLFTDEITDDSALWIIDIVDGQMIIQNLKYQNRYLQLNSDKLDKFAAYEEGQLNLTMYVVKE